MLLAAALRFMAAPTGPTEEDHVKAVRLALLGLTAGDGHDSIMGRLGEVHPCTNTPPAVVLLELAAEPIVESGATQVEPIEYEGIGGGGQGQGEAGQTAADLIRD
jgi:hypothetical protein